MEKNLLLDEYWTDALEAVCEHIKHNCDPDHYCWWPKRGLIVADDETGELLASVKEALKYEELVAAEKVNEIIVDEHWPLNSSDKCWQKLLAEARRINHGLLVINVNDIRIFKHIQRIKWLIKNQEDPKLKFNGYVLLVIKDIQWTKVKDYAKKYHPGEFDATMQFYYRIRPNEY